MSSTTTRAALIAALALASAATARADFVAGQAGTTQPYVTSPAPGVGGTIDFAVYERADGTAGDVFGTGVANFDTLFSAGLNSGKLDTSAHYLYLFQTINNGPSSGSFPIDVQGIFNSGAHPTSSGTFAGTSFSETVLGTPAGFGTPSPVETDGLPTILAGRAGLLTPSLNQFPQYLYEVDGTGLKSGQATILWGFTSNTAGFPMAATLSGGGTLGADGGVVMPGVVPEPSSLALAAIGRRPRAGRRTPAVASGRDAGVWSIGGERPTRLARVAPAGYDPRAIRGGGPEV